MISQYESMNEEQCSGTEGKQDLIGVEQGEREIGEILKGKFVFLQNLGYEILVATWSTRIDSVSFRFEKFSYSWKENGGEGEIIFRIYRSLVNRHD